MEGWDLVGIIVPVAIWASALVKITYSCIKERQLVKSGKIHYENISDDEYFRGGL